MNRDGISQLKNREGFQPGKLAAIIFLLILVGLLFWPAFQWMNERFFEENSYYSHGWLIPPAIVFLIWQREKLTRNIPPRPSWFGLILFVFGIILHLIAWFLQIRFISGWALILTLLGLCFFNWGFARSRLLIGPLLLMIFMLPLPGIWIIALTFRLKILSASIGVALSRLLGIEIWQKGVEIILPTSPPGPVLTIGDPCSGLRSLLSFGALGGFFSLLLPITVWKSIVVFSSALILAPVNNIIRVVSLIVFRQVVGPQILGGPLHIAWGVVVFFFCFLLFLQVVRWALR